MNYEAPPCPICLDDLSNELSTVSCGHLFHANCLKECTSSRFTTCPTCRKDFKKEEIVNLQYSLTMSKNQGGNVNNEFISELIHSHQEFELLEKKNKDLEERLSKKNKECLSLQQDITQLNGKVQAMLKTLNEAENKVNTQNVYESLVNAIGNIDYMRTWADNLVRTQNPNELANTLYKALILSTQEMQTNKVCLNELRMKYSKCITENENIQKANFSLRKENERLMKEKTVVVEPKVTAADRAEKNAVRTIKEVKFVVDIDRRIAPQSIQFLPPNNPIPVKTNQKLPPPQAPQFVYSSAPAAKILKK